MLPEPKELREEEHNTGLDHLAQVEPSNPVYWLFRWQEDNRVAISSPEQLAPLIANLSDYDTDNFGGIQVAGSTGPWAQVIYMGSGEYCLELHPYQHDIAPDSEMMFERIVSISPTRAARIAWGWVRKGSVPADQDLEMRVIPDGDVYDVPF